MADKFDEVSSKPGNPDKREGVASDYDKALERVRRTFLGPEATKVDDRLMEHLAKRICNPEESPELLELARRLQRFLHAAYLDPKEKEFYNAQRGFFLAFKAHTNQKHNISMRIREGIPDFLPITEIRRAGHYLSFLDIGPGDGGDSLHWSAEKKQAGYLSA